MLVNSGARSPPPILPGMLAHLPHRGALHIRATARIRTHLIATDQLQRSCTGMISMIRSTMIRAPARKSPSEASTSRACRALWPQEADKGTGRDSEREPIEFQLQDQTLTDMVTTIFRQKSPVWHWRLAEAHISCLSLMKSVSATNSAGSPG